MPISLSSRFRDKKGHPAAPSRVAGETLRQRAPFAARPFWILRARGDNHACRRMFGPARGRDAMRLLRRRRERAAKAAGTDLFR